jgi:hypothetical protein
MKKIFKIGCLVLLAFIGFSIVMTVIFYPSDEEIEQMTASKEKEKQEKVDKVKRDSVQKWASVDLNVRTSPEVKEGVFSDNQITTLKENQMVLSLKEMDNGFEKIYNSEYQEIGWVSSKYLMNKPYTKSQIAQKEKEKKKKQKAENRKKLVDSQFSSWDGSHYGLVSYVKNQMNDPKSFEHAETWFRDDGNSLYVMMKFRGKNSFGGLVLNEVSARVDFDGNVIEIVNYN